MTVKIKTNNVPRALSCLADLPKGVQGDFEYVEDAYEYRFVQYKGIWYDVWDTQAESTARGGSPMGFTGWHSFISDSYFSGVVFRFADDHDRVVCGRYTC